MRMMVEETVDRKAVLRGCFAVFKKRKRLSRIEADYTTRLSGKFFFWIPLCGLQMKKFYFKSAAEITPAFGTAPCQ